MWVKLNEQGVQIREEVVDNIWLEQEKKRGRGQKDWLIMTRENFTGYEQPILRFKDYDEASVALSKIVMALENKRSRLEL